MIAQAKQRPPSSDRALDVTQRSGIVFSRMARHSRKRDAASA